MNPILAGVLSALGTSGIGSLVAYLVAERNRRAKQPQVTAQAESVAADTARKTVQQLIDNLRHDVADARTRTKEAETAATAYRTELKELEKRLNSIEDELTEAHAQNEILSRQLDTAYETVKQLQKQNNMLLEYFRAYQKWEAVWYEGGHPEGVPKPPTIDLDKLANP